MPEVLFICTGNFYRSRFAEAVFNYHCSKNGIPWSAFSRGLAIHMVEGDLSPHAEFQLKLLDIPRSFTPGPREYLSEANMERAEITIALDHREHYPMMANQFPEWQERITYWDAQDTHLEDPDYALIKIEKHVRELIEELAQSREPVEV